MQELWLVVPYMKNVNTHKFIDPPTVSSVQTIRTLTSCTSLDNSTTAVSPPLCQLVEYINSMWMQSNSIYGFCIWTNYNTEGWHHWLNSKTCHHNLPFYQLVWVLPNSWLMAICCINIDQPLYTAAGLVCGTLLHRKIRCKRAAERNEQSLQTFNQVMKTSSVCLTVNHVFCNFVIDLYYHIHLNVFYTYH